VVLQFPRQLAAFPQQFFEAVPIAEQKKTSQSDFVMPRGFHHRSTNRSVTAVYDDAL